MIHFSLRINGSTPVRQYYSGDLQCFPDLGTLVLINISDIEKYISGVVKAEGGSGKNIEYLKHRLLLPGHICINILINIWPTGIMYVIIHIVRHLMDYLLIQLLTGLLWKPEDLVILDKDSTL